MRKLNKKKVAHNQNGMALVLTLMAVSFMVAITVQLSTSVNWQMQGAGNLRDSIQLDAINRSGLNLIRAALAVDFEENKHDSFNDSWNQLGKENAPALFGPGKLNISVTDLSGLLQVNALVPLEKDKKKFLELQKKQIDLWKRFLTSGKFAVEDESEAEEIIDALIDWIDEDEEELDHGAESGYYLSLSPSYEPRNAPLTYPEELLLIRGMTKELLYGNEDNLPLSEYLTVAGREGKININSAPLELLMALDVHMNMSEETGRDLIEYRQEEGNKELLANPGWYKQVNDSVTMDEDLVDIKSQYFAVSVVARHNKMTRNGKGILERDSEKGVQKLLYWEVR